MPWIDPEYLISAVLLAMLAAAAMTIAVACGLFWFRAERGDLKPRQQGGLLQRHFLLVTAVVFLVPSLCLGLLSGLAVYRYLQKRDYTLRMYQQVVLPAREAIDDCRDRFAVESVPSPRGRLLIWDDHLEKPGTSAAWPMFFLPTEKRADPNDKAITVCLLVASNDVETGEYKSDIVGTPTGIRHSQTYIEVCVIHWPSLRPMGRFGVIGQPRVEIERRGGDRNGRLDSSLPDRIVERLQTKR